MQEENKDLEIEKLLRLCLTLVEDCYRFFGKEIEEKELKFIIDSCIEDTNFKNYLEHKYILKDTYENTFVTEFVNDLESKDEKLNDVEEMYIK